MTRPEKLQWFHRTLIAMGAVENKKDILSEYKVHSSKELTDKQLDELIKKFGRYPKAAQSPEVRKWRSNVLVVLQKYGIYVTNNDWGRVNEFLLDKRVAGKVLYDMSLAELKATHKKLCAMYDKWEEKRRKTLHLTMMN